jgi:quinolinate synthase
MAAPFPSLTITAAGVSAEGAFAESQAAYLEPDPDAVTRLADLCRERNAGIVAHYYMDAELQGVLYACDWPHVWVSDSLLMADAGVRMVEKEGCEAIVVLGVDFMSENVRAMLDAAGHADVPVWRVAEAPIGCSLAESAESRAYAAWLQRASETENSLHVVYINTSLRTKARAHATVPTVTCTSSNVVKTILQASAQEPDVRIWFGPDTYMGQNLASMFETLAGLDDAAIKALHPAHDQASIRRVREQFEWFRQGNCVVHHMFGAAVVARVEADYPDAHVTAHLEVPGEMFELGLAAQRDGRGVVGSTSDILRHIEGTVDAAIAAAADAVAPDSKTLEFILGTEAGMVSAIVRGVGAKLRAAGRGAPEVRIVFPVAEEAVSVDPSDAAMPIVPGVPGGEGCSPAGGCATCPFMKMNSLDALLDVLDRAAEPSRLEAFAPRTYEEPVDGRTIAEVGGEPILHMRHFQRHGAHSDALIADVRGRGR